MSRKWLKINISILISLFFLYLASRKADLLQSLEVIKGADPFYLSLTAAVAVLTILIRAYRWRYFFNSPPRLNSLFSATSIGLMVNNLLPARVGEFVRAYMLGMLTEISKSASFGTVVLERVFDVFTVLLILGVCLIMPLSGQVIKAGYVALTVNIVILIFLFFLRRYPVQVINVLDYLTPGERMRGRLRGILSSFIQGLSVMGNWKSLMVIFLWSLMLWGTSGLTIVSALKAFHIEAPFFSAYLVLSLLSIGMMIPSAPSSIGPFQFFTMLALDIFQVPSSHSLGFSIGLNALLFLVFISVGLICIGWQGVSLKKILKKKT